MLLIRLAELWNQGRQPCKLISSSSSEQTGRGWPGISTGSGLVLTSVGGLCRMVIPFRLKQLHLHKTFCTCIYLQTQILVVCILDGPPCNLP